MARARDRVLFGPESRPSPLGGLPDPNAPRREADPSSDSAPAPDIAPSAVFDRGGNANAAATSSAENGAVPAAYRDWVARYFRRLAQDASAKARPTPQESSDE